MRHPVAKGQPRVGRPAHLGSITSRVGGGWRGGGGGGACACRAMAAPGREGMKKCRNVDFST